LGSRSRRWEWIKKTYNELPGALKTSFALAVMLPEEIKALLRSLVRLKPIEYLHLWTRYDQNRGMSRWHDLIDWVGGYPYEVAKPEGIFDFYRTRGFRLTKLQCGGVGLGCNQFVFLKES